MMQIWAQSALDPIAEGTSERGRRSVIGTIVQGPGVANLCLAYC